MILVVIGVLAPSHVNPEETHVPMYLAFVLHFHQPIYYPGDTIDESYFNKPTDPGSQTTIRQVFEDCGFCYQRPAELVNRYPEARITTHFTGSLVRQLDWLAENGFVSKGTSLSGIWDNYRTAASSGRMEIMMDGFYHPIFPLIGYEDASVQFNNMLDCYGSHFQTTPKGFFPPELAFGEEIIPWLKDFGMNYVLFDSFHIMDLPDKDKWSGEYCDYAFHPHLAGDPQMIVLPREHWLGQNQQDGFDPNYLVGELEKIQAHNTDPSRPFLVVIASDGENGWMRQEGGGYYDWFWPGFMDAIAEKPWIKLTTPSEYLENVYTPEDAIAVELGSWGVGGVNMDLSTWNGSDLDEEMWKRIDEVREELQSANAGAEAWNYFAMAETSCYFYWDSRNWADKCYSALELARASAGLHQ